MCNLALVVNRGDIFPKHKDVEPKKEVSPCSLELIMEQLNEVSYRCTKRLS
jgi:hypothetical protein